MPTMTYKQTDLYCDKCNKQIDGTPDTCLCDHEDCYCWECIEKNEAQHQEKE